MLRATVFPAPYNSQHVLTRSYTQTHTCHFLAPTRVTQPHSSLVSCFKFQQLRQPRVILRAARGGKFPAPARKKIRRRDARVVEMKDDDDEEEEDDVDVGAEYDDEEEEDDDDGEMLPLEKMRKMFEKKPKGFGEGKVYDTSLEDKLLEEMRKSREAQAENLKKLKNNPASLNTDQKKKDAEVVPTGCRVRLGNLPKKKNIHRDLKSAFQGIPGIMNIVPAVSGNKKTRDPVCKGFAFVDFKHKKDAARFIELYSGQSITFGKIQKQIDCELVGAQSSSSTSLQLSKNLNALPLLPESSFEEDSNEDSNMDDSALSSWDETFSDDSDDSDDMDNQIYEEQNSVGENPESFTAMDEDYDDSVEMMTDSESDSLSSEQVNENLIISEQNSSAKVKQERKKSKEKAKKVPKLDVPGSAKRLKVKEQAVLSDVFSKYGSKAAIASKDS